ncbi:hypothetical protein SAMN05443377_12613 [Propionibacterium cyclohexanicum]|uniref:Uncharacterized protein n=1 Tax=Propionibacterium cyclohexanicum TaxID=64702 RepID=A0A1H9TP93_9ACTN|nr:hypothetical protein SAMN05443377_12613 [Propionibacterium cyclohexanicum]
MARRMGAGQEVILGHAGREEKTRTRTNRDAVRSTQHLADRRVEISQVARRA